MGSGNTGQGLFGYCDLSCEYAELPKETAVDGSGSCRTFVALFCRRKNGLVHKNHPCSKRVARSGERA